MNDINYNLRVSYQALLFNELIINEEVIPVYYAQVPQDKLPATYVLINAITNRPLNSDDISRTITQIQLQIVTRRANNNDGFDNDELAYQIYTIIYPSPNARFVQIPNGQVVSTNLASDTVLTNLTDGVLRVINRIITFEHIIVHYPFVNPNLSNIYYGVQNTPGYPSSLANKIITDATLPFTIPFGQQSNAFYFWIATPIAKSDWEDVLDPGNNGTIGGDSDLFANTNINIFGSPYVLQQTRYVTAFTLTNQVKFS